MPQAQLLAVLAGIIGIQHHGDVFGIVLRRNRLGIIPGVELLQVKLVGGGGLPQPQAVHRVVFITGHRDIERQGQHVMGTDPAVMQLALVIAILLGITTELHPLGKLGTFQLPGIAIA